MLDSFYIGITKILSCQEQIQEDIISKLSLPVSVDDHYKLNRVTLHQHEIDELCEIVVKNFKTLITEGKHLEQN